MDMAHDEYGRQGQTVDIEEASVSVPGEDSPKKVGIVNAGNTIRLYLLSGEDAANPDGPTEMLKLLNAVNNHLHPNAPLRDFNWQLRSGYCTSTVDVDELSSPLPSVPFEPLKPTSQMNVSNSLIYHAHSFAPASLDEYRVDKFGEVNPVRVREIEPPQKPETYYTQPAPDGKTYFFEHNVNSSPKNDQVVYVDTAKLVKLLEQYSPQQVTSDDRLEAQKKAGKIDDWTERPQSLMKIGCGEYNGQLSFGITAGSADMLDALRASKVERFPVAVSSKDAKLLASLCGESSDAMPSRSGASLNTGPATRQRDLTGDAPAPPALKR
jgi:hypothetical protein